MKKITVLILLLMPLWAIQCKNDENEKKETDCGCDSETVTVLNDVEGVIDYPSQEAIIIIFLSDNPNYALVPCNFPDSIKNKISIDKLKIRFSGKAKKSCTDTRLAGQPFILSTIKILSPGE